MIPRSSADDERLVDNCLLGECLFLMFRMASGPRTQEVLDHKVFNGTRNVQGLIGHTVANVENQNAQQMGIGARNCSTQILVFFSGITTGAPKVNVPCAKCLRTTPHGITSAATPAVASFNEWFNGWLASTLRNRSLNCNKKMNRSGFFHRFPRGPHQCEQYAPVTLLKKRLICSKKCGIRFSYALPRNIQEPA